MELGEELAKTLASRLLGGQQAAVVGKVTLTELFARYEAEVSVHKKGPSRERMRVGSSCGRVCSVGTASRRRLLAAHSTARRVPLRTVDRACCSTTAC